MIDPATAATALQTGVEVGSKVWGALKNLIGVPPRGDFQKFARTIYPQMASRASETGKPVYAYWFGDVIKVEPSGSWSVVYNAGTLAAAQSYWQRQAEQEAFSIITGCQGSEFTGCTFQTMGPPSLWERILGTGGTETTHAGMSGLLLMGGIVAVAVVIFGLGGKR